MPIESEPKFKSEKKVQEKGGVKKEWKREGLDELTKKEIFGHLTEQEEAIENIFNTIGNEMSNVQREKLETVREKNKKAFGQLRDNRPGIELSDTIDLPSREEDETKKNLSIYEERVNACKSKIKEYEAKRKKWKEKLGFSEEREKKEI